VGYVVIDVDGKPPQGALDQLCEIPGTIRCRVLV
jgi:D-3-phosphoglycerate dehydrogenase